MVLLLYYFPQLNECGLKRAWACIGSGNKVSFLPQHAIARVINQSLCNVLLAVHLGTGCDYLSKIGTKYPALNANPEVFLSDFGKGLHPATDQLSKAKAYLVKLFPHSKGLKTFNQLRVNQFHVKLTSDFSGDAHCTMEVFSQGKHYTSL